MSRLFVESFMPNAKSFASCAHREDIPRFALSGSKRHYERPRPFTVDHIALDVDLDVAERRVVGIATLDVTRRNSAAAYLPLDAVGFVIEEVNLIDGEALAAADFEYDGDELRIAVPTDLSRARVQVHYQATPRRGLYFLRPDPDVPDRPHQVWSQCQDEDARHWFPCHDAPNVKATFELRVLVPSGWVVLSNGICVESGHVTSPKSGELYHYVLDAPHPSYLVTLVAGEFSILVDRPAVLPDGRKVAVGYYVPKGREAEAWRSLGSTPRMIELFSRLFGVAYPFDRYSQVVVHDFIFGGMENTTATTLYEHVLLDETAALDVHMEDLVAHELAHQWFGDLLTCRDWSHAWLNEGFATFCEHVELEHRVGRDAYDWAILGNLDGYLEESQHRYERPVVCQEYAAPIDLFDRHLYEKGALVLHMLRRELGDDGFWASIRSYLERHRGSIVETRDLAVAVESTTGAAIDRLFDEWLFRPGHPNLQFRANWQDGLLTASLTQTQKGADTEPYALPFEVVVMTASGKMVRVIKHTAKRDDAHVLSLPARPRWVAFDPELRVPAPVQMELPADWLTGLLRAGPTLRVRVLAARGLAKRDDVPSIDALGQVLRSRKEPWMIRAECARALGDIPSEESLAHLLEALSTDAPEVRRAATAALGRFRDPRATRRLSARLREEPSYLVRAELCKALGNTRGPEAREPLLAMLDVYSWSDIVRAGALEGLASLGDRSVVDTIRQYTRYGFPSRGRRAAVLALARLGDPASTRQHFEQLMEDPDPRLRIDVARALVQMGGHESLALLRSRLDRERDGRVVRRLREAAAELTSQQRDAIRTLTDEIEGLRRKVDELEGKLSRSQAFAKSPEPRTDTSKRRTPAQGRRRTVAHRGK